MIDQERPTLHCSNRLECLIDFLGEVILSVKDPFVRHVIFLPHYGLKAYLSSALAKKIGACFGMEWATFSRITDFLLDGERVPSPLALSFALEQSLKESDIVELKSYLQEDTEKRLPWIAQELSSLFYEYSLLELQARSKWLEEKSWQQQIWEGLFATNSSWKALDQEMLLHPSPRAEGVVFHLFGFSQIPKHLRFFFSNLSAHFYFLSPCEMFWEDLCTDRERIFLEKKMRGKRVCLQVQEQLRFFLQKTHPLLANWGRVGRDLLRDLGELESYMNEAYQEPEQETLLASLQKSLLFLEEGLTLSPEEDSLRIVSAPSKLREVEILAEIALSLHEKHGVLPQDIVVLSTNILSYIPYIHAVFGSRKESFFDYAIQGFPAQEEHPLTIFLTLVSSRFSLESVLDFFSLKSVQKKWEFHQEEIDRIAFICREAGILWGLDASHKSLCLEQETDSVSTWEEGFSRILLGLCIQSDSFRDRSLDWTEIELLEKWMLAIASLQKDLRPVYEKHSLTISQWIEKVEEWCLCYFSLEEDALLSDLRSLEATLGNRASILVPFSSFHRAISDSLSRKKGAFQSSHLQAIKFLPLEEGSFYPAKVLYVLGCDEESFPRKEKLSLFSINKAWKEASSSSDQDRYLFLTLLLHAREKLIFSYQRISAEDQKPLASSCLIEELLRYIQEQFPERNILECLVEHHPAIPFSAKYFSGKNDKLQSTSQCSFSLATHYYAAEKIDLSIQSTREVRKIITPKSIDIKEIEECFKNPLKRYCESTLGITFPFTPPKDREFFLSALMRSQMERQFQKKLFDEKTISSCLTQKVPRGLFGQVGKREIEENIKKWKEHIAGFGLTLEDVFSMEFSCEVYETSKEGNRLFCPAPSIEVRGEKCFIEGVLPFVSSKGLLWFGKKKKQEYPIFWPSFLLFVLVTEELQFEQKGLLVDEGKYLEIGECNKTQLLSSCIELFLQCHEEPCFVQAEWLETFLYKDAETLQKKLDPSFSFSGFIDPYEEWMIQRVGPPQASDILTRWQDLFYQAFSPLYPVKELCTDAL